MKKNDEVTKAPEAIEDVKMNDKQMNEFLKSLSETIYWKALVRLANQKTLVAENTLRTIDMFKEPTEAARNQGKIMFSFDIISYVENLSSRKKEEEDLPLY